MNVNELEEAWVQAGREGMAKSIREMQEGFQLVHRQRLERREWRRRWIQTRLGPVRVEMLKVRAVETGQSVALGRDLLEMAPRQRATSWVERRAVELRVRGLSYRQAADVLGDWTGTQQSAMWLWRRVQARGRRRCARETEAIRSGARLTRDPPKHLYLEADEIHLKAQRSKTSSHRVKVGLSYSGRERVPGYRRPRYRLSAKRLYGGIESFETFGRRWHASVDRHHCVNDTEAVLYLSDGDPGLRQLREMYFPQAIGQHDWAHVFRDIQSAAPDEARRARWVGQLCEGRDDLVKRRLKRCRRDGGNPEAAAKVLRALDHGDFYGWKRFRDRHDPQRTQKIPRGSGGIEKNQEITIGRAMKKRGMAWTARGANNLAKLIFAWQDKYTWNSLWQEPFPP